jgi:hypothetical protein
MREAAAAAVKAFWGALDPAVTALINDDQLLERFHDWLADEALAPEVRSRRVAGFSHLREGCASFLERPDLCTRLAAGEDADALVGERLEASKAAVSDLPSSLFETAARAQRDAWGLELTLSQLCKDLRGQPRRIPGWALRAVGRFRGRDQGTRQTPGARPTAAREEPTALLPAIPS